MEHFCQEIKPMDVWKTVVNVAVTLISMNLKKHTAVFLLLVEKRIAINAIKKNKEGGFYARKVLWVKHWNKGDEESPSKNQRVTS